MNNLDFFIRQYESETGDTIAPNDKVHMQIMTAAHMTPTEYLKHNAKLTFAEYVVLSELHSWIISKQKGNL